MFKTPVGDVPDEVMDILQESEAHVSEAEALLKTLTPGVVSPSYRGVQTLPKDCVVQITNIAPFVNTDGAPKRIK